MFVKYKKTNCGREKRDFKTALEERRVFVVVVVLKPVDKRPGTETARMVPERSG